MNDIILQGFLFSDTTILNITKMVGAAILLSLL